MNRPVAVLAAISLVIAMPGCAGSGGGASTDAASMSDARPAIDAGGATADGGPIADGAVVDATGATADGSAPVDAAGPCADECVLGAEADGKICQLWDSTANSWIETVDTDDGHLHDRARVYDQWLHERLLPVGGVMRGYFTDATLTDVAQYGGTRDSPIWTGIYLGAEAMRLAVTGAPDALRQVEETVRVLDRWWRISGDRGYLARYAAPADSPPAVLAIFDPEDPENHRDVQFEGDTWHWKGNVSRDQYQGVFFGFAMAYDLVDDESLREIIRADIVATVEQLMESQTRYVNLTIDGVPIPINLELQHVIYTDDEMSGGVPSLDITLSPFDAATHGILTFWPHPNDYVSLVPSEIYQATQALQLGGMFAIALHVTEGVPAYALRRAAIQSHYDEHFSEWLDIAENWENNNDCGSSYFGLNIAFIPAFNWVRLESDPGRRAALESQVLDQRMWPAVADHKNVWFAYLYASQTSQDASAVVTAHNQQLRQFPEPPNLSVAVDNRGDYPENPSCEGDSLVAIDVADRIHTSFVWERNPWKLVGALEPNLLFPGVDYLATYWMARYYGFLSDDAAGTCLQWR